MFTLAAADTLAADADAITNLAITVFGMELNAGVETYKVLYQGTLPASATTIYTVPSSTTAFIRTITVVNNDAAASHTFQLFRGGTAAANAITPVYTVMAGGSATYEDGLGWSVSDVAAGTSFLNDAHTGYQDWTAISNPSAPSAGILRVFARTVAGRTVPKWIGPAGLDTPMQAALWGNTVLMFYPNTGTTAPLNVGTPWATTATIGHPAPTAGAYTQMKRTTSTNVITTQNIALGVSSIVSTAASFWRGNAAGLGGFFFFARFGIETLTAGTPNATRLFVGLQSGTTSVLVSDTIPAISCIGLWHDTTDGANVISLLTKDGSTATKNTLNGSPTTPYATGQGYDFYLYARPNDSTIYYRLDDINLGTILSEGSITTTIPANTAFMGPVVGMSNGTANIVAGTVGIGVNRIYIESDH